MISRNENPDYVNSFLDYSINTLNKSTNSVKEYNYDLAMFLKYIKVIYHLTDETDFEKITYNDVDIDTIRKITSRDISNFLSYLATEHKSKPTTRARKASTIRIFFKYLFFKEKLIDTNPAENIETPKLSKRLPKYLNLQESEKLLETASNPDNRNNLRDFAILTIFLNCGLRLSELVNIDINDIDFSENKMTVIGKGDKERVIYLNKACVDAIKDYLEVRPKEGIKTDKNNSKNALFLSERKERIGRRTVQDIVYKELKAAGLATKNLSAHKLRHTAATLMYQYGKVDIRALQEVLGHESISTTEIYTHVASEQVKEAIQRNPLSR